MSTITNLRRWLAGPQLVIQIIGSVLLARLETVAVLSAIAATILIPGWWVFWAWHRTGPLWACLHGVALLFGAGLLIFAATAWLFGWSFEDEVVSDRSLDWMRNASKRLSGGRRYTETDSTRKPQVAGVWAVAAWMLLQPSWRHRNDLLVAAWSMRLPSTRVHRWLLQTAARTASNGGTDGDDLPTSRQHNPVVRAHRERERLLIQALLISPRDGSSPVWEPWYASCNASILPKDTQDLRSLDSTWAAILLAAAPLSWWATTPVTLQRWVLLLPNGNQRIAALARMREARSLYPQPPTSGVSFSS